MTWRDFYSRSRYYYGSLILFELIFFLFLRQPKDQTIHEPGGSAHRRRTGDLSAAGIGGPGDRPAGRH